MIWSVMDFTEGATVQVIAFGSLTDASEITIGESMYFFWQYSEKSTVKGFFRMPSAIALKPNSVHLLLGKSPALQ